jgi:hypothetical protein
MDAYSVFSWIESSALSVWIRESPSLWAFPFILILHTVGMGLLVGTNIAIDLRLLGFAPRVPLSLLQKIFIVMKLAFLVNAISGILLLSAYPTKALTNPLFYIKLFLIGFGLVQTGWIRDKVLRMPETGGESVSGQARVLAASSLVVWAAAVTTGRLLAYTYTRLLAGDFP